MRSNSHLNFPVQVKELFAFLEGLGFSVIKSQSTIVRYIKYDTEIDIYHGRKSYQIGADITISGVRYSISEVILASDLEAFKDFHYMMATTPEGVNKALKELSTLMKVYCNDIFEGKSDFIDKLEEHRKQWSKDYALDVLAKQLRPKASEAFRKKDYSTAANLYSRIQECLSSAELKKLSFAIKHSKST